jgi:thiol:disulfide interchange protein DsbD
MYVMRQQKIVFAPPAWTLRAMFLVVFAAGVSQAAHTSARLLLAADAARPGQTVMAGVELTMDPGWHTYWRNSGASGMPTTIEWRLPPGLKAGPIRWPLGAKLPEGELTTYVYSGKVMLLVPLQIAPAASNGVFEIAANVSWLECEKLCLPGDAKLSAKLEVSNLAKPSADTDQISDWIKKVPAPSAAARAVAAWEGNSNSDIRAVIIEWLPQKVGAMPEKADFYPYSNGKFEVQPGMTALASGSGKARIRKEVKKIAGEWPSVVEGVIVEESDGVRQGFEVSLNVAGPKAASGQPLWLMLLYAFLGGLILNIMPCVLPVISLKILGFVNSAGESPARVRSLGLIYAVGVVFSFLILAGIVIGFKAAGQSAGWGMQFGNPQFIIGLGALITLVALNLFGVFEVNPGGKVLDAAGSLASKQGAAGAFFNGVLATILATPCTAPFLGAALGFAFLQPAPYIVLIFVVVALGLAAPYVLLSWNPGLLRFLPKPGAWMERFKIAMGFPMLATAVWLASLLPVHYGDKAWWFGMFLAVLAFAAWLYGEFIQRGRTGSGLAMVILAACLGGGYWFILEKQMDWRAPPRDVPLPGGAPARSGGIAWQEWSAESVAAARAEGRVILVDFTADWCLTCQANKKFAIEVPQVQARLKELNAVAFLGDYTRLPPDITLELNRFGRAGVPLVLVYPKDESAPPIVLPEALTPGLVLDALGKAAGP